MVKRVLNWQRGDPVVATVVEIIDEQDLILRFGGGADQPASQIMRVANQSRRALSPGDKINMRVVEVDPLRFQYIADQIEQRRRGRLDVSV